MTSRFILRIPRTIHDAMLEHARAEQPHECVGMLVGTTDGVVVDRYPLVNELQSPTRFLSEPRSMLRAEKQRRAAGLEVLAIYHSHPTSAPVPSRYDIGDHYAEGIMCVIVGMVEGAAVVRGWWICAGAFEEGEVVVE